MRLPNENDSALARARAQIKFDKIPRVAGPCSLLNCGWRRFLANFFLAEIYRSCLRSRNPDTAEEAPTPRRTVSSSHDSSAPPAGGTAVVRTPRSAHEGLAGGLGHARQGAGEARAAKP